MPPLGLAYLGAALERSGYSVRILDQEVTRNRSLTHYLAQWRPACVGISGTTHTRFESFALAGEVKRFDPGILVVYGGVHATFAARHTLEHNETIDIVVRGEGEETLVRVMSARRDRAAFTDIPGISYRHGNDTKETPDAPRIDLDTLAPPAYHLLDMDQYALKMGFVNKRGISVITSRGCLARCAFCSASRMYGHALTVRSPRAVVDDISLLIDRYGYEGIKVFDSTFTMKRSHVAGVCNEIMRRGLRFPWECEIRVGTVDRSLLEMMKSAGCYYVDVGIESGSQGILDRMHKGITVDQARTTLQLCHDAGLKVKAFFSIGHIGETMADAEETLAFIDEQRRNIDLIAAGVGVRLYPGTEVEDYARQNGLLPDGFSWSAPYRDRRLERLLQTPTVPILVQPGLAWDELESIGDRIYADRFRGIDGLWRGMSKLARWSSLKKLPA